METQIGSDKEGMCTLRLGFFKDLCKHQAAQISDLNAQVATQQEHIARLEAYISKLEAKANCSVDPQPVTISVEGSAHCDVLPRTVGWKGKGKEIEPEPEREVVSKSPQGLSEDCAPASSPDLVGHAAEMSPSKRDRPITRDAEGAWAAARSWNKRDNNTATATAQPSEPFLPVALESNPPCTSSRGGSPPRSDLGKSLSHDGQDDPGLRAFSDGGVGEEDGEEGVSYCDVVLEPKAPWAPYQQVDTAYSHIPGQQSIDVVRANVSPDHGKTSTKELGTHVPATLAGAAKSSRSSGHIARSTQEVEEVAHSAQYIHLEVPAPPEIISPEHLNPKTSTLVTQVKDRNEGPAPWTTGWNVGTGVIVLGGEDGAKRRPHSMVRTVSLGLEPLDGVETCQNSQQPPQVEIGPAVEYQKVGRCKRKAEGDPFASFMESNCNSEKVRSTKQKRPLSVVQSMKTRRCSHKGPSFSASRADTSNSDGRVQSQPALPRQSAHVREDLTMTDKPVPAPTTSFQTMRNTWDTFPATARAKDIDRAKTRDRIEVQIALLQAVIASESTQVLGAMNDVGRLP